MIRNTAGQSIGAQMINASTGASFAGVVTVFITVDAGIQAIGSVGGGVCALEGNGYYTYLPSQAETNGALIAYTFTGVGAVPATIQVATVTATQSTAIQLNTNPNITPLTAVNLITNTFVTIGVLAAGETPDGALIQDGFRRLNNMMGQLAIQPKTIPVVLREIFALVAGKGGVGNEYSYGPGGDFNSTRPNEVLGAGLLLNSSSPPVEVPLSVMTDAIWQDLRIKDLSSLQPTAIYYNATFNNGLGLVNVWPVPTTALNSLVCYRNAQLTTFPSLTATYYVPNGYDEMLEYQLAMRLSTPYRKTITPDLRQLAVDSLANVKRANYRLIDLPTDPAITRSSRGGYNILSGSGG